MTGWYPELLEHVTALGEVVDDGIATNFEFPGSPSCPCCPPQYTVCEEMMTVRAISVRQRGWPEMAVAEEKVPWAIIPREMAWHEWAMVRRLLWEAVGDFDSPCVAALNHSNPATVRPAAWIQSGQKKPRGETSWMGLLFGRPLQQPPGTGLLHSLAEALVFGQYDFGLGALTVAGPYSPNIWVLDRLEPLRGFGGMEESGNWSLRVPCLWPMGP